MFIVDESARIWNVVVVCLKAAALKEVRKTSLEPIKRDTCVAWGQPNATALYSVCRRRWFCDYRSSRGDDTSYAKSRLHATKSLTRALTVHVL